MIIECDNDLVSMMFKRNGDDVFCSDSCWW
jgi:hypothetical protein